MSKKSSVWTIFEICEKDKSFAKCTICKKMFSRGGTGKSASTSPLLRHLKNSHVSEYKTLFSNINEGNQPGTSKSVFCATSAVASSSGNINNMMQPTVQQFVNSKKT